MPLVKEARSALPTLAAYTGGSIAGGAVTGSLISLIAIELQPALSSAERAAVVGLAASVFLWTDLRARLFDTPSLRRQTCSTWYRRLGPTKTFLIWGFDLGLGFSTIRVSSLFWVVVVGVAVAVPPDAAPAVMAAYGLSLPISLLVFVSMSSSEHVGRSALALAPTLQRVSLTVLIAFATSLFATLVVQ